MVSDHFDNYIEAVLRTAPDHDEPGEQLQQGALGLIAEYREYYSAIDPDDKRAERGDMLWYVALLVDGSRAIGDVRLHTDEEGSLATAMYELCGAIEGWKYQQKDSAADDVCGHVESLYSRLIQRVDEPIEVMRANINKLTDRYPDGFEAGGGQREEER